MCQGPPQVHLLLCTLLYCELPCSVDILYGTRLYIVLARAVGSAELDTVNDTCSCTDIPYRKNVYKYTVCEE